MRHLADTCRCGHEGLGDHPCHGGAYTCRKPSIERLAGVHHACLAGAQLKFGAYSTWACDACWDEYRKLVNVAVTA